jgi:hypothetical protein
MFADFLTWTCHGGSSGQKPTVTIKEGSVEATSWFARGVGLVRQVEVLSLNFELPNGVKTKSEERKVKELSNFVVPGASFD